MGGILDNHSSITMIKLLVLLALFSVSACLCAWLPHRWLRRVCAIALAGLSSLQIGAWYLTGQWLDDRAINHLNWSDINHFAFQFKIEMGLFVLLWMVLTVGLLWVAHWLRKQPQRWSGITAIFGAVVVAYPPGMMQPLWRSAQIAGASASSIDAGLQQLGIDPETYVKPQQVKATAGKNLVVISLESIEQGYMREPLNRLTPNLIRLSQEWTLFPNMPPLSGSDWTSGSMYTVQPGLPALFNQTHFNNNHLFQTMSLIHI